MAPFYSPHGVGSGDEGDGSNNQIRARFGWLRMNNMLHKLCNNHKLKRYPVSVCMRNKSSCRHESSNLLDHETSGGEREGRGDHISENDKDEGTAVAQS